MDYKPVFEILWKLANTTMILNLTYKKNPSICWGSELLTHFGKSGNLTDHLVNTKENSSGRQEIP